MANPRDITQLPAATNANDSDLALIRQGNFDKKVEISFIRAGSLQASNNLSDLTDTSTARSNLGLSYSTILQSSNNLSDLANVSTARTNLDVPSTSEALLVANELSEIVDKSNARANLNVPSTTEALLGTNNLNDVNNTATARTNLDVPSTTEALLGANNLSDVDDAAQSRLNLGIDTSDFLSTTNNLSDLDSIPTARTNLDVPSNAEALLGANNLSDVDSTATSRTNLDVPSNAEAALVGSSNNYSFNTQIDMQFQRATETQVADGSISGTYSIDLTAGQTREITLSGSTTFTFDNVPASGLAVGFTMYLTNGGDHSITWPASVIWPDGTAPTLTSGGTDILVFTSFDNGTTWYGVLAGLNMS